MRPARPPGPRRCGLGPAGDRHHLARDQRGLAMLSVLAVILVIALLSGLVLYLSGKEVGLSAARTLGAQALALAEGGGFAARAALMVLTGADPLGVVQVHPSVDVPLLNGWYAAGDPAAQNSFRILDYLVLDGQRYTLNATPSTNSVTFVVNWGAPQTYRKLQVGVPAPANPLGNGSYTATVTLTRRLAPHPSCSRGGSCYVHRLAADEFEFNYAYAITSNGLVPPRARRRVTLAGDFSMRIRRQNFARYALFTHIHTTPAGQAIWFTSQTSFDGPVHTNGEFRFAFFPKFGTPDSGSPCDPGRITSTTLTSVSTYAWFNNNGSPRRLQANENVVGGTRRDAPVLPDCTPGNTADDNDNPAANFTRGVATIPMPANPYSQKGVSIGRDPTNTGTVSNAEIRAVIPELPDNSDPIPPGIYLPVTDLDGDGVSDPGEPLAGGIYVQGNLTSLTLGVGGPSNNLAVYTLQAPGQTVTVTVDRDANVTTVTNTSWPAPQTRTFRGVPKGWQAGGSAYNNATIIYVEGDILGLGGTLEEKEQTTIVAAGRIDITDHLRYEDPPNPTDPADNPLNVLGLYTASNDIRVRVTAPRDIDLHGVMMAGNPADGYNSSVFVENYNTGTPRGTAHILGGLITEYYGPFGTFDPRTGLQVSGYARDFRYDRRMSRGLAPPYFPTTSLFEVLPGGQPLAGVRPVWREAQP